MGNSSGDSMLYRGRKFQNDSWQVSSIQANYQVLLNPTTNEQVERYQLHPKDTEEMRALSELMERRRQGQLSQWVTLLGYSYDQSPSICNTTFPCNIYTQRVTSTFETVRSMEVSRGMEVLEVALKAFAQLKRFSGREFRISDRMIGYNSKGDLKVWLSEQFGDPEPSKYEAKSSSIAREEAEHQMVQSILQIVEKRLALGVFPAELVSQLVTPRLNLKLQESADVVMRFRSGARFPPSPPPIFISSTPSTPLNRTRQESLFFQPGQTADHQMSRSTLHIPSVKRQLNALQPPLQSPISMLNSSLQRVETRPQGFSIVSNPVLPAQTLLQGQPSKESLSSVDQIPIKIKSTSQLSFQGNFSAAQLPNYSSNYSPNQISSYKLGGPQSAQKLVKPVALQPVVFHQIGTSLTKLQQPISAPTKTPLAVPNTAPVRVLNTRPTPSLPTPIIPSPIPPTPISRLMPVSSPPVSSMPPSPMARPSSTFQPSHGLRTLTTLKVIGENVQQSTSPKTQSQINLIDRGQFKALNQQAVRRQVGQSLLYTQTQPTQSSHHEIAREMSCQQLSKISNNDNDTSNIDDGLSESADPARAISSSPRRSKRNLKSVQNMQILRSEGQARAISDVEGRDMGLIYEFIDETKDGEEKQQLIAQFRQFEMLIGKKRGGAPQ